MKTKNNYFNIPNILSALRLLCTPILAYLVYKGFNAQFIRLFITCLMSDIADGFIARRFNLQTRFGARLDSVADMGIFSVAFFAVFYLKWNDLSVLHHLIIGQLCLFVVYHSLSFLKFRRSASLHTYANKLSGYLLGLFFISLFFIEGTLVLGYVALIANMLALIEGIVIMILIPEMIVNAKGLYWILQK